MRQRDSLEDLTQKNIDAISRIEQAATEGRPRSSIVADAITAFCGSMLFVWVHCLWFVVWLLMNGTTLFPQQLRFDPAPFSILTLIVSLEAIFLSTFILISQNHQQSLSDKRNHLDLQINLLAEQESSELLRMMRAVMEKLGVGEVGTEAATLEERTDPQALVAKLEEALSTEDSPAD